MNRNPNNCPHNVTEFEDGEEYCTECGITMEVDDEYQG